MIEFISEVMPERVTSIRFDYAEAKHKPNTMFSFGVERVAEDEGGLKIIPFHGVTFVMSKGGDERHLRLTPSDIREWMIPRLLEMVEVAEKKDAVLRGDAQV